MSKKTWIVILKVVSYVITAVLGMLGGNSDLLNQVIN